MRFGGSRLQISGRRIVARVDGIGEKFLYVVGPELADVRVALDHRVNQLSALPLAFADEDVAYHVAKMVELHRPARSVGERDLMKSLGECAAIIGPGRKLRNRRL